MSSDAQSTKPPPNQTAERLKAEGNQLHQQGQFRAAYEKYSEAIKEDGSNAIYYANRAASSLALKEYLDAAADSVKATQLDPTYAKAWSRHATACSNLCSWTRSIESWKKALACLPPESQCTETEKRLRTQFSAGLKKSEEAAGTTIDVLQAGLMQSGTPDQMPWQKAKAMEASLRAIGKMSSAFVILSAYESFKQGVDAMKQLKKTTSNGQPAWLGRQFALELICNGVMEDPRVFHFDCSDWMDKYNNQVMFEAEMQGAWKEGGPNVVKQKSVERLQKEGWEKVRPAMAVTIRAWIMAGFQAVNFGRHVVAVEFFTRAEEVLKWGSKLWDGVTTKERGVVFEKTFIRAVSRMRLNAMHQYLAQDGKDCPITLDEIIVYSREIVDEVEANSPNDPRNKVEIDFATFGSFYMYPRAEALSILGWCFTQKGLAAKSADEAQNFFSQSAAYYLVAAEGMPLDDEYTAVYFKAALEAHWWMPECPPVMTTLSIVAKIQQSFEGYKKIWGHSPIAKQRDPGIYSVLAFGLDCIAALAQGRIVESDIVKPGSVQRKDKWGGPEVVYL